MGKWYATESTFLTQIFSWNHFNQFFIFYISLCDLDVFSSRIIKYRFVCFPLLFPLDIIFISFLSFFLPTVDFILISYPRIYTRNIVSIFGVNLLRILIFNLFCFYSNYKIVNYVFSASLFSLFILDCFSRFQFVAFIKRA